MQAASLCWTKRCDFSLGYLHTRWQSLCSCCNLGLLERHPAFHASASAQASREALAAMRRGTLRIRSAPAGRPSSHTGRCWAANPPHLTVLRWSGFSLRTWHSGADGRLNADAPMGRMPPCQCVCKILLALHLGPQTLVVPSFRGGHRFSVGLDTCTGSSKIIARSIP